MVLADSISSFAQSRLLVHRLPHTEHVGPQTSLLPMLFELVDKPRGILLPPSWVKPFVEDTFLDIGGRDDVHFSRLSAWLVAEKKGTKWLHDEVAIMNFTEAENPRLNLLPPPKHFFENWETFGLERVIKEVVCELVTFDRLSAGLDPKSQRRE